MAATTARVARSHLEHSWLPMLARVAASRAMVEFDASGPAVVGVSFGFGRSPSPSPPGPPRAIPASWGSSNAAARAAADAAMAAGEPGRFVGRTQTYEVIETPPSTSIPSNGHDPDGGSGSYDSIVEDHWFYEHNLATPPAPFGATPVGGWMSLLARLARLAHDDADEIAHQRGLAYEELCKEARGPAGRGGISWRKNVAVGRLTTTDGDDLVIDSVREWQQLPPGLCAGPRTSNVRTREGGEYDTEVKILEEVAPHLRRRTTASWRSSPNGRRVLHAGR